MTIWQTRSDVDVARTNAYDMPNSHTVRLAHSLFASNEGDDRSNSSSVHVVNDEHILSDVRVYSADVHSSIPLHNVNTEQILSDVRVGTAYSYCSVNRHSVIA